MDETSDISELFHKALNQVLLGNYSNDITITGTAGQIVLGLSGIDFIADIRDLTWDVTHWEFTWDHASQTALDSIALIPVIGVIKNTDSLKNIDELVEIYKSLDKISDTIKCTDEVAEQIRYIIKNSDRASLLKHMDLWAELSTQTGKNADIVVLGKFQYDNVSYLDVARKLNATYYNNDFYDDLGKILNKENDDL